MNSIKLKLIKWNPFWFNNNKGDKMSDPSFAEVLRSVPYLGYIVTAGGALLVVMGRWILGAQFKKINDHDEFIKNMHNKYPDNKRFDDSNKQLNDRIDQVDKKFERLHGENLKEVLDAIKALGR